MTPPPTSAGRPPASVDREVTTDEIRRAVREGIEEAFFNIGIDLTDRDSLDEYQADRAHLRKLREASEVKSGLWLKSVFAAFGGIMATLAASWIIGFLHLGPKP